MPSSVSDGFSPFSLVTAPIKLVTKPIKALGEAMIYSVIPEEEESEEESSSGQVVPDLDDGMSLEGTLFVRRGKATVSKGSKHSTKGWRRQVVILDFENEGSLTCFNVPNNEPVMMIREMYTKIHRSLSVGYSVRSGIIKDASLFLSSDVPWVVKDVDDASSFLVEIPTNASDISMFQDEDESESITGSFFSNPDSENNDETLIESFAGDTKFRVSTSVRNGLQMEFEHAKQKDRPMRFYFRCPRKGNEKTLWLRAFAKLGRLSSDVRHKAHVIESISSLTKGRSRFRKDEDKLFVRETRQLEMGPLSPTTGSVMNLHREVQALAGNPRLSGENREFRVSPTYCYPHVWMTRDELTEECNLPSTEFHDLRIPSREKDSIGALRVEVLQCMGLPKLDRNSESDAVVYLVCGSYAFATDVIPSNKNPMWLRKTRRACIMPLFHGYGRLYVGVFDDDGKETRDDLAGRVVVDLARLRPGCAYDVVLPLRQSCHVYSRRPRGVVRLRFQFHWKSERQMLLSYLPKTIDLRKRPPRCNTTVMCSDAKSFRNIAITVHGIHLPNKFTFSQFKATLREINFTRKMVMIMIRHGIRDIIQWVNPAMSLYVFCAWMYCVWINSFSLVPAFLALFLLLHMVRMYAIYGIDGPSQRGFVQPTFEEMSMALVNGGPERTNIEPMELRTRKSEQTKVYLPSGALDRSQPPRQVRFEAHKPLGKRLFRCLGFLESQEELNRMSPNERHLEFPFADGIKYPKWSVREALCVPKPSKRERKAGASSPRGKQKEATSKPELVRYTSDQSVVEAERFTNLLMENMEDIDEMDESMEEMDSGGRLFHTGSQSGGSLIYSPSPSFGEFDDQPEPIPWDQLPPYLRIPEQDIDKVGEGPNRGLIDDMNEIKDKMHETTWHLFNDKTHVLKHPDAAYFGASAAKSNKRKSDVENDLQRLLQVGQYSSSNPIISKIGVYMEPLIGASRAYISVFRAGFNIYTWRDPVLSFWVFLFGMALVVILFVLPWRLVLGVGGLVIVGPQNLIFRLVRERRGTPTQKPYIDPNTTESQHDLFLGGDIPEDQPLVSAHPPIDHKYQEVDRGQLDPREIHHVVVPYSRLMYQRFYDWPPEQQHAHVRRKDFVDSTVVYPTANGHNRRRFSSDTSVLSLQGGSSWVFSW